MIHEFIDTKKKLDKNNKTKGTKTLAEFSSKSCYDSNIGICDHSDSENKGASSTSNTFIPPWLKNSLGFSQRNKQNLDWNVCLPSFTTLGHAVSDQKSSKTIPKYKEHEKNDSDSLKANVEPNCTIRVTCDDLNQISLSDNFHRSPIAKYQNLGVCSIHCINEKQTTPLWNDAFKNKDYESVCAKSEMKLPNWEDGKPTNNNEHNLAEVNERHKEEEKKKVKLSKLKTKIKRNNLNDGDHCSELNDNKRDDFSKLKVKEGPGHCPKKYGHSFNVDINEFEAKPKSMSMDSKCRETDILKLNQQEFCMLQEIKERTENKVKFEKLINHIRESNLKNFLKSSDDSFKTNVGKFKMEENEKEKLQNLPFAHGDSAKTNSDKEDSLKSTDEENDIKRFSEFLSKNKNIDEKKKCLEEVRNYFERKRRTRLTQRRFQEESKLGKYDNNNFTMKKDDLPRERPDARDPSAKETKEKKSKFVPCNEEVVEKAVSETLQKFMSLYHFQVSPTIIRSMRKNILEAIQSDSLDSNLSKKNEVANQEPPINSCTQQREHSDVNFEGKFTENLNGLKDGEGFSTNEKKICSKSSANAFFRIPETAVTLQPLPLADVKESKKNFLKTLVDDNNESGFKSNRENDVLENENFRRLKREFENCLKSVQFHADGTGLKIQSLVLEKEETTASKGIRFVYNFSKKSLELIQLESDQVKSSARGLRDSKRNKNGETQTFFKLDTIKRSMKCQTAIKTEVRDRSLQTEVKMLTTNFAQTEDDCSNNTREVKEIKSIDISPGLYRMVKSKDAGRFYLYPEKEEELKLRHFQNTTTDSFESKCNNCESKSGRNFVRSKKFIFSERFGKSSRVLQKNKYRGKGMKRTNKKITSENGPSKFSKEESVESKVHTSISCLFFRNGKNQKEGETNEENDGKDESVSLVVDEIQRNGQSHLKGKDDRFGCFLFWNGERIGPGCDLKTHVETLLKEKLNEIKVNADNKILVDAENTNKNFKIFDANKMSAKENFQKDLCSKSNAAVICFRKDYSSKMKILRRVALPDTFRQDRKKDKTPSVVDMSGGHYIKKEKCYRDVGTQNCSNEISTLNRSKKKSVSKTSTGSKMSGKRWKSSQGSKQEGFGLGIEELVNFVKVVKNIKRFRKEAFDDKDLSPESSFGEGGCTTTFPAKNNNLNNWRNSVGGTKSQIGRIPSWENLSVNDKTEDRRQEEVQESKQWDLIDSVLNKVSLKEKESLWNNMRQLIKGKLGRDIDEEGAKEVCIEIEQDMPTSKTGKSKHAVVARGHYVKSEGDVEVEIDLTMADLEKILRQRNKKMRRRRHLRPIYNFSKGRKLASSSSTRSEFTSK